MQSIIIAVTINVRIIPIIDKDNGFFFLDFSNKKITNEDTILAGML